MFQRRDQLILSDAPRDFRFEACDDRFGHQSLPNLPRDLPRAASGGAIGSRSPRLGFGTIYSHSRPRAALEQQQGSDRGWECSAAQMREPSPHASQLQLLLRSGSAPLVSYQAPQQRSLRGIADVGIAPCWPPPPLPPVAGKLAQRIGALEAQQSALSQSFSGDSRHIHSGDNDAAPASVSREALRDREVDRCNIGDASRELLQAESLERFSQHDDTVTCVTMGSNPETDHRPASAHAENERLRFEIRSLQTMLETEQSFREELQTKHAAAEGDLQQLRVDLERLQQACDSDTGTRRSTDDEHVRLRRQLPSDAEPSRMRINFSQLMAGNGEGQDALVETSCAAGPTAEASAPPWPAGSAEEFQRKREAELRQVHAEFAELKASAEKASQECAIANLELQRSRSELGEARAGLISEQAACREAQSSEVAGRAQLQKAERQVAELTSQVAAGNGSEAEVLNAALKAELEDALKARDEARATMEELRKEHVTLKSETVLQHADVAKVRAQLEEVMARVGGSTRQAIPQAPMRIDEGKKPIRRASTQMSLIADQQTMSLHRQGEAHQAPAMRHATTDFGRKSTLDRDRDSYMSPCRSDLGPTDSLPAPAQKKPAIPSSASAGGITVDLLTDRGRLRPQSRGSASGSGSVSRSSSSGSGSHLGSGGKAGRPMNVVDLTGGMPQR